jgi:hypothetical protein
MKSHYIFSLFVALLLFNLPAAATNQTGLSGRQILDQVSKRQDKPYEFEVQDIVLIDKSGSIEKRELQRYKRDMTEQETRHLLIFSQPSGVRGVSLLTWQHKDSADDQWLYLPASGQEMKRIAKGGRKNYFMGTDYTFEDLAAEDKDKFNYERLADEVLDGVKSFVVKSVATDPELQKETGYGFHKLWVSQDHLVIIQIDFFDSHAQLIKRQRNLNLVNVEGETFRANKVEMENFANQHKTIIDVRERSFAETAVAEKIFKERAIVDGSLLR